MKPLKIGITGKPDPTVLQLVDSIVAGATGKAELANSPVSIAALTTLGEDGATTITDEVRAKEAWLMQRTVRRNKMREVRTGVKRFATHAHSVYAGDKEKLQALGLDVIEIAGPVGVLPAPSNVRSRGGELDGTITVRWRSVTGRDIYIVECSENASGPWTEAYRGAATSATCSGLTPGKEYFFRVRAWGTAGPGAWSDITKTRAA
jgi:hypothetical protein